MTDTGAQAFDPGKFFRLQGLVQAAIDSVSAADALPAASAMTDMYERVRMQVRDLVPAAVIGEFDGLFPGVVRRGTNYGSAHGPPSTAERQRMMQDFHDARSRLAAMAGWLGGFVAEAKMQREVEAYARERVMAEQVGFRAEGDHA